MEAKRIILAPSGSDGDTFPMLLLAKKLQARGHSIVVCGPPHSRALFEDAGFTFEASGLDIRGYVQSRDLSNLSLRARYQDLQFLRKDIHLQSVAIRLHVKGAYAVFTGGFNYVGSTIAEAYGLKHLHVFHVPNVYPTDQYPCMNVPWQNLPLWMNQLTWKMNDFLQNRFFKSTLNSVRKALSLPPVKNVWQELTQNSILAVPRAIHQVPESVRDLHAQTSYWFPEIQEDLPKSLLDFIQAGPAPFYFGLGSMGTVEKSKIILSVREVCQRLKLRAVISRGWADFPGESDSNLYFVGRVSHEKLFQKMRFVVHHGGPGTVSTAAKAGIPQVIIPHIFDQFYWGERLFRLNIAPKPIMRSAFSAQKLQESLESLLQNPEMFVNAKRIHETILTEKGIDGFFEPSLLVKLGLEL